MSERKINLKEILNLYMFEDFDVDKHESYILAMEEACRQTLELAAENAKIEKVQIDYKKFVNVVSKQSILETIKQVE